MSTKKEQPTTVTSWPGVRTEDFERIVKNNFAFKILELMRGGRLCPYGMTPKELADQLTAHNTAGDKIKDSLICFLASITTALNSEPDADDLELLSTDVEAFRVEKGAMLRDIVKWLVVSADLARRHVEALKLIADELATEVEEVVEAFKEDSERIGSGVEVMPTDVHIFPVLAPREFDLVFR
jgi:hypothetical protein